MNQDTSAEPLKKPVRVAVTGAAGQIGYSLLFRIAAGEMLGKDQPIFLNLLEIPPAMDALRGVAMELEDCAFPLVQGIVETDSVEQAFTDVDVAMLVGARPRSPGMERGDLIEANGAIFSKQGEILNEHASKDVKTLVVGNPANTNCLIALRNAPDLSSSQFGAMTRLDHNRAVGLLAQQVGCDVTAIKGVAVWGNHSPTMFPDLSHATVNGSPALGLVSQEWYETTFIPSVQQRGAAILNARGLSSAASAANAAIEQMRDWYLGSTPETSLGVLCSGQYGIAEEIVFSFPVSHNEQGTVIDEGRELDEFCHSRIAITEQELLNERAAIDHLL